MFRIILLDHYQGLECCKNTSLLVGPLPLLARSVYKRAAATSPNAHSCSKLAAAMLATTHLSSCTRINNPSIVLASWLLTEWRVLRSSSKPPQDSQTASHTWNVYKCKVDV